MSILKNKLTEQLEINYPLIVAPMAGGPSSPSLVVTCSQKGALGSIGAAYSSPEAISENVLEVRSKTNKAFGINLFVPTKLAPLSKEEIERAIDATSIFRNQLSLPKPELTFPYEEDFDLQFEAVLRARPKAFSFIFGMLLPEYIKALRDEKIIIIGTATSLEEALKLSDSGVDAVIAQGIESGGHRGIFDQKSPDPEIKTFDLVKTITAKTKTPVIAAGGIMSKEDILKMLNAGAMCVQMGTAFLATNEAGTSLPYKKVLIESDVRNTKTTRAFSGRLARGVENYFMKEMDSHQNFILPFPAQNKFTRDLRATSAANGASDYLSLWSGSGKGKLWTGSAQDLIDSLFSE